MKINYLNVQPYEVKNKSQNETNMTPLNIKHNNQNFDV